MFAAVKLPLPSCQDPKSAYASAPPQLTICALIRERRSLISCQREAHMHEHVKGMSPLTEVHINARRMSHLARQCEVHISSHRSAGAAPL